MGLATKGPKLFTCPQCRKAYLGYEALPDCPACGFDYRAQGGFRWDVIVYLLSILGLMSYFLVSSSYRTVLPTQTGPESSSHMANGEKLPGKTQVPIEYPPNPQTGP